MQSLPSCQMTHVTFNIARYGRTGIIHGNHVQQAYAIKCKSYIRVIHYKHKARPER